MQNVYRAGGLDFDENSSTCILLFVVLYEHGVYSPRCTEQRSGITLRVSVLVDNNGYVIRTKMDGCMQLTNGRDG